MAQLRDRHTSEILAEGTPLEIALVALELGADEVLFDDVGEAFDPAQVIDSHRQNLAALEAMAADPAVDDVDGDTVKAARAPERTAGELVAPAENAMNAARERAQ